MERLIDLGTYPVRDVLPILLKDRTTEKNIIWAADTYEEYGEEYSASRCMRIDLLMNGPTIQPRIAKNIDAQLSRTKKFAEVFTPSWLCNQMNNHCDEVWFGRKDVFNRMEGNEWIPTERPIVFPKRKRWQRYVDSRRLEITCGEAPYLTSRYDAVTGESIPYARRIGILDRKLRIVNENATDEAEWWKYTCRAFESTYGYEYQGDNLLIARINLLSTFVDSVREKWNRNATDKEIFRISEILTWNIWQMDGLKGTVPFDSLQAKSRQLHFFEQLGIKILTAEQGNPKCRIMNWREQHQLIYLDRKRKMGKNREAAEMKFDFVIGNPPYQEESVGEQKNFAAPVYHHFLNEAYKVSDKVLMIHPARFLFNAGSTPKKWNEQMLSDPHFKVAWYEQDSSKVFCNTDIKGGVVISYHNANEEFGSIGTFTPYPELNNIMHKAAPKTEEESLTPIVYNQNRFDLVALYQDHPEYQKIIGSDGRDKRFRNNIFDKIDAFTENRTTKNDIPVIGVIKNKRTWRYLPRHYIESTHENLQYYKVLISSASGIGALGESLGNPYVAKPNEAYTQTFIGIGAVSNLFEAQAIEKYLRTKFCRILIGVLKITQHITPGSFRYVPLQDFTSSSDINWSVSVAEIDRQLYKKYSLNEVEIAFIEKKAKEMA